MVALGEAALTEKIKTIGLFRNKAKNVIALSQGLIERHGGQVPRDREALEALPGVGRKTANVVLNVAFGEPTIAVDTHVFRVANRLALAPGKTPREVEDGLMKVDPRPLPAARAPLADPARPLRLQGARARMRPLHSERSVPVEGEDGVSRLTPQAAHEANFASWVSFRRAGVTSAIRAGKGSRDCRRSFRDRRARSGTSA